MPKMFLVLFLLVSPVNAQIYLRTVDVVFKLTAEDNLSDVRLMKFSNDDINWSVPEDFKTEKTNWNILPGNGQKTIYVKFMDFAGNWSESFSTSFILDTIAPNGTIDFEIRLSGVGIITK